MFTLLLLLQFSFVFSRFHETKDLNDFDLEALQFADGEVCGALLEPLSVAHANGDITYDLQQIGRTEDIAFSPLSTRVAIASFSTHHVTLLEIAVDNQTGRAVTINALANVRANHLRFPHGLAFVSETLLLVACRDNNLVLVDLPPIGLGKRIVRSNSRVLVGVADTISVPVAGSVAVVPRDDGTVDVLVCNNYIHTVTSYSILIDSINTDSNAIIQRSHVLIATALQIPDGIAVSLSAKWIAISNHLNREVLIYRYDDRLSPQTEPIGRLTGVSFPHGLRFVHNDAYIVVADAGLPYLHVYEALDADWTGDRDPARSLRVMSNEAFRKASHVAEAGTKGVGVSLTHNLVATTTRHQSLSFFHLDQMKS